jgi:nucleotide-binding universal stress UspA family protein
VDAPKRILIPTDFSDVSEAALRYGLMLSGRLGSSLHLLHVLEDPLSNTALAQGYALPTDFIQQVERNARERLGKLLTEKERVTFRAEGTIREGSPFVEIVRYAREQQIDLIVMGTHGRGPIAHMLLGSVAEQVLRKAPCPVLVVRQPEHEFVMP